MNEQAEESYVKCDNDNKSEGNMLEESSIKVNSVLESLSMISNEYRVYFSAFIGKW